MTTHKELLAAARGATGLDDFGDDSFLEGLERLVRSLRDEASMNAVGEAAGGITRIEAETVVATYELGLEGYPQFPVLSQCTVRYGWDDEETYGMLERSSMRDKIFWP